MHTNWFMRGQSFRGTGVQMQRAMIGSPAKPVSVVVCKISDVFSNRLKGLGAGFETPVMYHFVFE